MSDNRQPGVPEGEVCLNGNPATRLFYNDAGAGFWICEDENCDCGITVSTGDLEGS